MKHAIGRIRLLSVCLALLGLGSPGCDCDGRGPAQGVVVIGEMEVVPETVVATGLINAEVVVRVYKGPPDDLKPLRGASIRVLSSRNQGTIVDLIRQPLTRTDANGEATATFGSTAPGEAYFTATVDGTVLCKSMEDGLCVPEQKTVIFANPCPQPDQTLCSGECVDLQTDPENCGSCGNACDDDNVCNGAGTCLRGSCAGGTTLNCDDDNPCTDDSCDPSAGCQYANNTLPCDDSDACTMNDTCSFGRCTGDPLDADSDTYVSDACMGGNDCNDSDANIHPNAAEICDDTIDNDCDGYTDTDDPGCAVCIADADCDDANVCNGSETCVGGYCVGGTALNCDDGNVCTDDLCDPQSGCQHTENDSPCDDSDDCTMNDTCADANCTGVPLDADSDTYVSDACVGGSDCDDSNANIHPNAAEICSDLVDNDCDGLTDSNDTGCAGCTTDADCIDGNACNGVETCLAGSCVGGTAVDCDDGNVCTDDVCDPADGSCTQEYNTNPCEDGNPCTVGDVCSGGACQSGTAKLCDDRNDCTDDSCDPSDGSCLHAANSNPCSSSHPCILDGICRYKACQLEPEVSCDDGNTCTDDVCDRFSGICYNFELPDGSPCDDGDECTQQDACSDGVCGGSPYACDDGIRCTLDVCNGDGTCSHPPGPSPLHPDYECPESRCDGFDNDCDGCTDEGCPGYPDTVQVVEVIPFSDQPGLRRISGNGQIVPHGTLLPNPLIVQVNDSQGNPLPCELVTFTIEPVSTVCYGRGGVYYYYGQVEIPRLCNTISNGTLVGNEMTLTDANGQASIGLQLPQDEIGLLAVSATAGGDTTHFFAFSSVQLGDVITVPLTLEAFHPTNPALGPLSVTKSPEGTDVPMYLRDIANYTLAITGLSSTTGSTNGVASAPLESGGSLTIDGVGFSASGNTVWIGGTQANVTAESETSITVDIPEGMPGAAAVVVNDGTSTPFDLAGPSLGNIPSIASTPVNLFRTAPKPIFIFADTGNLDGTQAKVKLQGTDTCGNPLDLNGRTITLSAHNPDKATPSASVSVVDLDASSGVARVVHQSELVRSAVIIGTIDGVSSDWVADGNTVVSTVPHLLAPPAFDDGGIGNDDGINAVVTRGGDEHPTDIGGTNPVYRFDEFHIDSLTIPDGSVPAFETEAQLSVSDLTGEGPIKKICGGDGGHAFTGTGILSISGGPTGILVLASLAAEPSAAAGEMDFAGIEGFTIPGWLVQDVNRQELELNYSGLDLYDDLFGPRNMIIRLYIGRALP